MSEFSEVVTLAETNSVTLIHRGTGAVGPLLNSFHCPVCPKLKRQYVGIYSTCTVTAEGTYSQDPATVRVSLHRITIKSTFDPDICTITEASAAPVTTNFEIVFQKGLCLEPFPVFLTPS